MPRRAGRRRETIVAHKAVIRRKSLFTALAFRSRATKNDAPSGPLSAAHCWPGRVLGLCSFLRKEPVGARRGIRRYKEKWQFSRRKKFPRVSRDLRDTDACRRFFPPGSGELSESRPYEGYISFNRRSLAREINAERTTSARSAAGRGARAARRASPP
ncbi:hypothetical protein EVAR_4763_1 [Eumeta japonica]|uniref:Uncharacterized protein n=1 Tax=Eumeta variegata TaxID=151549 RepID=A0A4C1T1M2_EUMVA|nr:hypothetical protein EVAR_4763_1 [Eumeta japonica]